MEFFNTRIAPGAADKVKEVLDSGWLSEGKYVAEFEQELANFGLVNPVTVNSGTAALHLALLLAGVGPGDEVILPAQTFLASGTTILMVGAKPVFCDIDPTTGNMDDRSLESKITPKTKAIMPVHWGGLPCSLNIIRAIADEYSFKYKGFKHIKVIEDAAHAFGSPAIGKEGYMSDFVCFSFQAIKSFTTGDGGAVCIKEPSLVPKAKRLRWFGFERSAGKTFEGDRGQWVTELGYKYHMNNIAAAIGLANLPLVPSQLKRRKQIAQRYYQELGNVNGLLTMLEGHSWHTYWLFTVLVEARSYFIRLLRANGIPCSVVDRRIDKYPIFGGLTPDLPGQELFDAKQISIPVHEGLTDEDVDLIIETIKKGW